MIIHLGTVSNIVFLLIDIIRGCSQEFGLNIKVFTQTQIKFFVLMDKRHPTFENMDTNSGLLWCGDKGQVSKAKKRIFNSFYFKFNWEFFFFQKGEINKIFRIMKIHRSKIKNSLHTVQVVCRIYIHISFWRKYSPWRHNILNLVLCRNSIVVHNILAILDALKEDWVVKWRWMKEPPIL